MSDLIELLGAAGISRTEITTDMLRGATAVLKAQAWQPIETAPKNERIVVGQRWGSRWSFHHAWWNDAEEEWNDISSDRIIKPEVWMQLPKLPEIGL